MTTASTDLFYKLSDLASASNRPEWIARFHDAQHLDIFHPDLWHTATTLATESERLELITEVARAKSEFERRIGSLGWSLGAHQWSVPVGEVDQGDDGLFIDLLFGKDGSPLRQGDKVYLHPYSYRSAQELLSANEEGAQTPVFDYPEYSVAWHFFQRAKKYVADELESGIEQSFVQWWATAGERLTEHELSLEDLMSASWRSGVLKGEQGLARAQAELEQAKKQIKRMEKALLSVRRHSEDIKSASDASDALHEAAQIPVNLLAVPKPRFKVFVQEMRESHRTTHWVTLDNASRPCDAKIWDKEGRITPSFHLNPDHANESAEKWAKFLGVDFVKEDAGDA
jgi:hypothetical protein